MANAQFVERHRNHHTYFTRLRSLSFEIVIMLVIQKSLKSIQTHMHCFWDQLTQLLTHPSKPVTSGAWTQARAKLSYTAFIELNASTIVEPFYHPEQSLKLWREHRLLAIDGSTSTLPQSKELARHFGLVECSNHLGDCEVSFPQGRISVLYDVLNRLAVDSTLENYHTGEHDLALRHIQKLEKRDLVVLDRGYASFNLFLHTVMGEADFVCRCSSGSFAMVQKLFKANRAGVSRITTLKAPKKLVNQLKEQGYPRELKVRFVTVRLNTGELEVLATSLLDKNLYRTQEFGELYYLRWGIETFYGLLKGRLVLENYTGKTVEAVKQDFYAAIFISNLESVLIGPAQERLDEQNKKGRRNRAKVNHSVSFHAIKNDIIKLFHSDLATEELMERLTALMIMNPVSKREDRKVERKKMVHSQSLRYHRYKKKIVF